MSTTLIFVSILTMVAANSLCWSANWPQFRGPDRDGKSQETGLLQQWPKGGPRRLWSVDGLGKGCSSLCIAEQTVYTTGLHGKKGYVFAFDTSGRLKWKTCYGAEWDKLFPGARTTPTWDDGRLYVISGTGKVVCISAHDGRVLWSVDTVKRFAADCGKLGMTESPLVIDDMVVCTPGGPGATIVALDKNTGKTIWKSDIKGDKAAYCSPVLINRGDRKIVATMLQQSVVGVDAETGYLLWRDRFADYQDNAKGINFVSPVYSNGRLYTTSGDNNGGAMYELSTDGTRITRQWTDEILDCHHGGVVQVDGYVYGSNYRNLFAGDWVCLDMETGKVMYEEKWRTKGSTIYADGMLYCYEEKSGHMALVQPTPEAFQIISSFQVKEGQGRHIAHPAIADGVLYIRRGASLTAWDIRDANRLMAK